MVSSNIRAFIAIALSPRIQKELIGVVSNLKEDLRGVPIRWVPIENIHLTLKFLGDVPSVQLEAIKQSLATEAIRHSPFEINVGELGVFPSLRRPRVLWIGVQAGHELKQLQRGVEQGMVVLGYPAEERSFTPHLTLGRLSQGISETEIGRISKIIENSKCYLGTMLVEAIHLYRSDLLPGGAVYTRLFTASLKTA